MATFKRCSLSLPNRLAKDVGVVANKMGMSQSALISELLPGPINDLKVLLESVPNMPTDADIRRLRGESAQVIATRVREAMSALADA